MRKNFIIAAAAAVMLTATAGVSVAQTLSTAQVAQAQTLAATLARAAAAKGKASPQDLQKAMQEAAAASGQPAAVIVAAFQAVSVAAGQTSTLGQAAIGGATATLQANGLTVAQAQQQASSPPAIIVAVSNSNNALKTATNAVATIQSANTSGTANNTGQGNNPTLNTNLNQLVNVDNSLNVSNVAGGSLIQTQIFFSNINNFGNTNSLISQSLNSQLTNRIVDQLLSTAVNTGPYSTSN